jgi:putative membrane protein
MKTKLKLISHFAVIAIACGGLCFSASIRAQSTSPDGAQVTPDPNANKKELPNDPTNASAKSMKAAAPAEKKAPSPGPSVSAKDKSFMEEAAKGGMMEVEMGQMATKQGKSADVKKIGKRMVSDHTKANNELMALAKKKGVDLSKEKPKMDKMDDANFDKEYINAMVKDHEKDLAAFQEEAKDGSDPDVKAFAAKTSEVIKKHLAMVKAAQEKMK